MSVLTSARHLRDVRAAAVPQRLRATVGENAYAVYVAFLCLILLTSPYYAVITVLTRPDVLPLLLSDLATRIATASGWGLLAAAVLAGRVRGPVHLPPLPAALVGAGPWPRRLALRRPFLRSAALLLVAVLAVVAAPVIALAVGGRALPEMAVVVLSAGLLALVASVCWLAGQALPRAWSAVLAVALAALAPWAPMSPLLLGLALVGGGYAVPRLLDRLSGPALLDQARRWDGAGIAATTGDLAAAVSHLRLPPTLGARWPALGRGASLPLVFWRRDLVGSLRDPERFVLGCLGLVAAGLLGALAGASPQVLRWAVLALALTVAYLAAGPWSDGYRHVLEAAGAPTLYGRGTAYLLLLHSLLPLTLVALLGGAGIVLATTWVDVGPTAAVVALLGLVLALAARVHAAAKGPLPLALLTPVPTPMGDLSGLNVALWQVSSLLMAGVAVAVAGPLLLGGTWWAALGYLAAAVALVWDALSKD